MAKHLAQSQMSDVLSVDDGGMSRRRSLLMLGGIAGTAVAGAAMLKPQSAEATTGTTTDYNVVSFGAVGDGTTDDTNAVQDAIDAASLTAGGRVCFPPSSDGYLVGDLVVHSPVEISGCGKEIILIAKSTTTVLFKIQSSYVRICELRIEMAAASVSAKTFLLDTSVLNPNAPTDDGKRLTHVYLNDLIVWHSGAALRDSAIAGRQIVNLHLRNVVFRGNRGLAVSLANAFAFIFFKYVNVDNVPTVQAGGTVNFGAFKFSGTQGLSMEDCEVNGGTGNASGHGFEFTSCEVVALTSCMADTVGGGGFVFTDTNYIYLNQVVASLVWRGGIVLDNCDYVNGTNIVVAGRNQSGLDAQSGVAGIALSGCTQVVMTSVSSRFNTGDGIEVDSSGYTSWSNLQLVSNGGKGLYEHGTVIAASLFVGCLFSYNGSNYQITSAYTRICNAILHSGAYQDTLPGPASA